MEQEEVQKDDYNLQQMELRNPLLVMRCNQEQIDDDTNIPAKD